MSRFEKLQKLENERSKYKVMCSCGRKTVMLPTMNKEYVVCSWCHKKVFRDEEKRREQEKKVHREDFRMKMWSLL